MQYFDAFSILFKADELIIGSTRYPLGQVTTEILNMEDTVLDAMQETANTFRDCAMKMLDVKTKDSVIAAQAALNDYLQIAFTLPPYRDLFINREYMSNLFLHSFNDKEKWNQSITPGTDGYYRFITFIQNISDTPRRIIGFYNQVAIMLEVYFEDLPRRNSKAYGKAFTQYFYQVASAGSLLFPDMEFAQSFPADISFIPYEDGIAEETCFQTMFSFLYVDFYRALMHGNIPRRCQNCNQFFLLTKGYNTCYCNNIAPGETKRTCRQVGAHKKEAKEKASASPAKQEYTKTYNRLKARKYRGKISTDEWNSAVAAALDLKEQAESGKLTDDEYKRLLQEL